MNHIAIIGGSGFYSLAESKSKRIKTPFGTSGEIVESIFDDRKYYFLARHGKNHSFAPHLINYKANIFALKSLKVEYIFATNAVGSCNTYMIPGDFVVLDQILDFTNSRDHTYYLGNVDSDVPNEYKKVVHKDVSVPFDNQARKFLIDACTKNEEKHHPKGTIGVFNGPRYETAAEVQMAKILGCDVLGMTSSPEAFLARELDIKYASIAVVTNFGAGMQEKVAHEEVVEMFNQKINVIKNLTLSAAKQAYELL